MRLRGVVLSCRKYRHEGLRPRSLPALRESTDEKRKRQSDRQLRRGLRRITCSRKLPVFEFDAGEMLEQKESSLREIIRSPELLSGSDVLRAFTSNPGGLHEY